MEKYLYFTVSKATASNALDGGAEIAMVPTSAIKAFDCPSSTTTKIYVSPRDGAGTPEDSITLTHAANAHKSVIHSVVQMINADKNKSPFVVVADTFNEIFNIEGVTDVAIVSPDN